MAEEEEESSAQALDDLGIGDRRNMYVAGILVVIVVAAAAFLFMGGAGQQKTTGPAQNDTQDQGNFSDYAGASEDTGKKVGETAEIQATFHIKKYGIAPATAEISIGAAVKFVNENDFPVRLEFDRTPQTPVLQPGESLAMKFRGITYFTAYEQGANRSIGTAKINVQ